MDAIGRTHGEDSSPRSPLTARTGRLAAFHGSTDEL
jgi:hypothetical protein